MAVNYYPPQPENVNVVNQAEIKLVDENGTLISASNKLKVSAPDGVKIIDAGSGNPISQSNPLDTQLIGENNKVKLLDSNGNFINASNGLNTVVNNDIKFDYSKNAVKLMDSSGVNFVNINSDSSLRTQRRNRTGKTTWEDTYSPQEQNYVEFNGMINNQIVGLYTAIDPANRIKVIKIILQMGTDNLSLDGGWVLLQWRNQAGTSTFDFGKFRLKANEVLVLDYPNGSCSSNYLGGRLQIVNQTGETYDLHANIFVVEV
jgi:hypothetical protein